MAQEFSGSAALGRILADLSPLQCLDIGARGKPTDDLLPIAWASRVYGFEPDRTECDRLNSRYASDKTASPFKKVTFFPVALGRKKERRTLYLTAHRGASSLLQPIPEAGDMFCRNEYVSVEDTCEIDTFPLDGFLEENEIRDVVYAKIDVEGLELEILESATDLLSSSLMALRVEVAFLKTRVGQPYYGELECFLRDFDFSPMGFLELHHWRHLTKTKYPRRSTGQIPFSRGQIAHGDVLFFKNLESLIERAPQECMRAAFLAMTYGYIDYAYNIIVRSPSVREYIEGNYGIAVERELRIVSENLERQCKPSLLRKARAEIQRGISKILKRCQRAA